MYRLTLPLSAARRYGGRSRGLLQKIVLQQQKKNRLSASALSPCSSLSGNSICQHRRRWKSSVAAVAASLQPPQYEHRSTPTADAAVTCQENLQRLSHIRNVGIFAHVDAGKTTVTERMLALTGIVQRAGSVDDGNTVTDYLPAERERGITISSAAISFPWGWHNSHTNATGGEESWVKNDEVTISLIDTPGHVDFSVEVNRSVAVLDGAVLVVDAVAGVQAQTETVWRAMTCPSHNNHHQQPTGRLVSERQQQDAQHHEPLPCLAVINKMDKDGCHYGHAIQSLRQKLPGANPIPIQIPLFQTSDSNDSRQNAGGSGSSSYFAENNIVAIPVDEDSSSCSGEFVGVVDLLHMRAVIWPLDCTNVADVERCVPTVIPLSQQDEVPIDCPVTQEALAARHEFLEALAEVDERVEEFYLTEQTPSNAELRSALRRATLNHKALPVLASAALRGMGVEPVLDSMADLLPSPLDRHPPHLTTYRNSHDNHNLPAPCSAPQEKNNNSRRPKLGHPFHSSLLALAFKVVHMKGRGGGDGRVVFARVYSGELCDRDVVRVVSPPAPGAPVGAPRKERIGGMLELSGGRFGNLENGICKSGDVCALVGLKSVQTGDTIMMMPEKSSKKNKKKKVDELVCLSGVSSPKPVLKVRLEVESRAQQDRLMEALNLLAVEDPSLVVEETDTATLLSGLGELHIEVTLDRLRREFGLDVMVGTPFVTYRETITDSLKTEGLHNYDRTIGDTRLQGAVSIVLEPLCDESNSLGESACMVLTEPTVTVSDEVKEYLGLDLEASEEDLLCKSEVYRAVVQGCEGALKRGPVGSHAMANVTCRVLEVDAEEGAAGLVNMPGAARAAAAHAISTLLKENRDFCCALEPTMSLDIASPNDMVGTVLSDLTGSRRGIIDDVLVSDEDNGGIQVKALIRGEVPLVEILGYANSLRSMTGGEGTFSAEYKGHSPCIE